MGIVLGDTVVCCRPGQVREAAIILSCLSADKFVPLISLSEPPMSVADYRSGYREMERYERQWREAGGTAIARMEMGESPSATGALQSAIRQTKQARKALSAHRSWVNHNETVNDLLRGAEFRRVIFLFQPGPDDLEIHDPVHSEDFEQFVIAVTGNKSTRSRAALFDTIPERVYFLADVGPAGADDDTGRNYYHGLADLADRAWRLFLPARSPAERAVEVPAEGPAPTWLLALHRALRERAPLRPVETRADDVAGPAVPRPDDAPLAGAGSADEPDVVLVEDTGDAADLLGILYAHHHSSLLVVTAPPDMTAVDAALGAHREAVLAGRAPGLEGVEAAVSAQVPPAVLDTVGDRRLTAFTRGLPYNLVRTRTSDWSGKPIGHVAGDPAIIVLTEILARAREPAGIMLSAVIDPGFFQTQETEKVLSALRSPWAHPVLISGQAASFGSLAEISRSLPTELIYFNTHGNGDSVVLSDGPIDRWDFSFLMQLQSHALIFNNSCESWVSLGREFLRAGARGYVGTLWPVPAVAASDFAGIVMRQLVAGVPVSEAVHDAGTSAAVARAYIYVGTVSDRLAENPRYEPADAAEAALADAAQLVKLAAALGPELLPALYGQVIALKERVVPPAVQRSGQYLDLLLAEIKLIAGTEAADEDALLAECEKALRDSGEADEKRWACWHDLSGQRYWRIGRLDDAVRAWSKAASYGTSYDGAADVLASMAQVLKDLGRPAEARAAAEQSLRLKEDVETLGVLSQVCRQLGDYDNALRYADEGQQRARGMRLTYQEATFGQDKALVYLARKEPDLALPEILESIRLLRLAGQDEAEITALRWLVMCRMDRGELGEAESSATTALQAAERLGAEIEQGQLLSLLATVKERQGRFAEAISFAQGAAAMGYRLRDPSLAVSAEASMARLAERTGDIGLLWTIVDHAMTLILRLDGALQSRVVYTMITALKAALEQGEPAAAQDGLITAIRTASAVGEETSDAYAAFGRNLLLTAARWVQGDQRQALANARELDAMSGGEADLKAFFGEPYQRRLRRRARRR